MTKNKKKQTQTKSTQSPTQRLKQYEANADKRLNPNQPVVIRVDGKNFSTLTKGFKKPYDPAFAYAMLETTRKLAKQIPDVKLAYTQSDEISLVIDCKPPHTPWYGFRVQKLNSIVAAMASLAFTNALSEYAMNVIITDDIMPYLPAWDDAINRGPIFDARAFNVPANEVDTYLKCRQANSQTNALTATLASTFTHAQVKGKTQPERLKMLAKKGINFKSLPEHFRNGTIFVPKPTRHATFDPYTNSIIVTARSEWSLVNDVTFANLV